MANNIFAQKLDDHVIFDRIVDSDRTIELARRAADKADTLGQTEKAAKLRTKADQLEAILKATQTPDYSDSTDTTTDDNSDLDTDSSTPGPDAESDESEENSESQDSSDESTPDEDVADDTKATDETSDPADAENNDSHGSAQSEKNPPEDIANLDKNSGKHSSETDKQDIGGAEQSGANTSSSESGQNTPDASQSNNGQDKDDQGNTQTTSQEYDPFKTSFGGMGDGEQITPDQELEAIIKKLSSLTGIARKGADKGLTDYFNQVADAFDGDIEDGELDD